MESTDTSDFIYTISVQGHGAYPTEEVLKDPHIKVTLKEDDEARQNQLTYYANQIYEMDLFVAELNQGSCYYGCGWRNRLWNCKKILRVLQVMMQSMLQAQPI